ncbi:MAG: NAD(+)/NADH kinase [Muribaculaceae bacterium]|nr:NAD(+)/NADH kinase [Muribaculaceae bacterium]
MKKLAIFGNRYQQGHFDGLRHFFADLPAKGFKVYLEQDFASYLSEIGIEVGDVFIVDKFPRGVDCVVSIGGDGTFLQAAQWVGSRETPILGINTGHLGFLASYSLEDTDELLTVVANGLGRVERRAVIEVACDAMPEGFWPYALNEVAVLKGDSASMVNVNAEIDGYFLADYMSDGLVVATPTGSTAYNLSLGGPILQPTLSCLILSPIAAHSLTMRPLVVSGDSRIVLTAKSRTRECRVSLDGRSFLIDSGESLILKEAPFKVGVMRRPDSNFSRLLRNKLGWGRGPTDKITE